MATPVDFNQIKSLHEKMKAQGNSLGSLSLSDFASSMQEGDHKYDWSAGHQPDNLVGNISRGIDSGLQATGLPKMVGELTGNIGQAVDELSGQQAPHYQPLAQGVGEGLPRMLGQLGLTLGGFAAGGVPGLAMVAAGTADAGAKGYTDSGSVKQGLTSAAFNIGAPGIAKAGGALGSKLLHAALKGAPVAEFLANEIGSQGAFLGAMSAGQAINGENPFTMDNLFANAVGSLAFAPATLGHGMKAFREARLQRENENPTPFLNEGLIERPGVLDGGSGAQTVDPNNLHQLTKYLLGEPDAQLPESLKTGNLMNALKMTGLEDGSRDVSLIPETLNKREKGKELVHKAAQTAPEDMGRLLERAAKLLETEPRHLVDTINMIQITNRLISADKSIQLRNRNQGNLALTSDSTFLNSETPNFIGADRVVPQAVKKGGERIALDPITPDRSNRIYLDEAQPKPGMEVKPLGEVATDVTTLRGRTEEEQYQRDMATKLGPYQEPQGLRPQAVKGKVQEPWAPVQTPESYKTPAGLQPESVKGKQPVDLATKQRSQNSYADPFGFELIRAGLKGLGEIEGLRALSKDETRLMGEPSGRDVNGAFTVRSMRAELERLNDVEATPDVAQARLLQKVKNHLESRISEVTAPSELEKSVSGVMGHAFNNLGLSPALRETWVAAAQRVVETIAPEGMGLRGLAGYDPQSKYASVRGQLAGETAYVKTKVYPNDLTGVSGAHDVMATLAHESTHALLQSIDSNAQLGVDDFRIKHTQAAREYATTLDPEERSLLLAEAHKALMPEQSAAALADMTRSVDYAKGSAEEFLVEYSGLNALSKASAETKRNFLRFIPEPLQDFVKTVYRGIDELRKMVIAGVDTAALPGGLEALNKFHQNIDMIYSKDPVIEGMKKSLNDTVRVSAAMEAGDIGGRTIQYRKVEDSPAMNKYVEDLEQLKQGNGFTRNILQHQQTSAGSYYRENLPSYRDLVFVLADKDSVAVTQAHQMRAKLLVKVDGGYLKEISQLSDKKLTPEQILEKSIIARVDSSPKLSEGISDAMRKSNDLVAEAAKTGSAYPDFDHPEIQKTIAHLSPSEQADARHMFDTYREIMKEAAGSMMAVEVTRLKYVADNYLRGAGVPFNEAMGKAGMVVEALLRGRLSALPPELLVNEGTQAMIKHWDVVKEAFYAKQTTLNRPHFSEFRSGRFGFRYETQEVMPDGSVKTDYGYRSATDATRRDALKKEIESTPGQRIVQTMDHYNDPQARFGHMQMRGLEESANLIRAHWEAAQAAMKPEMSALFEDSQFDPAQPLVDKLHSEQQVMAPRRFAPGREKLNMIPTQDAYISLVARKNADTITRLESNRLLSDPAWENAKALKLEMAEFRDNILGAGRQKLQGFRKAVSFTAMGVNVAGGLTDATQPLTMGVWRNTQEVGFSKALGITARGLIEAFKPLEKIADKRFRDVLVRAANEGHFKTGGSLENIISPDDAVNYNVVRAGENRDMVDMKANLTDSRFILYNVLGQFSSLGRKGFDAALTPMKLSSQINNKSALHDGYQLGKLRGLEGNDLYRYAVNHMQVVNVQGSRAAHSSFKLKAGQANGAVEAATLLTNYPIAVFSQMASNWQGMLKSSGLSAEMRRNSMQAFTGQVLTQFALAGAGGLGLKGLFAFARSMFGVDTEQGIRDGLAAIDSSGTLGDVFMNGLANQITGIDFASRYDLSGVGGLNPYTGFDAKGLFGAGGGMITALYNAPGQFAQGDLSKMQLIPAGLRRILTANSDSAYTDKNGQKLIEPTAGEKFAMMLGYKPARMAQVLDQRSTMRETEQAVSEQASQRKAKMLNLMQDNKMASVQQMLNDEVTQELMSPEFSNMSTFEQQQTKAKLLRGKMLELVNFGAEKLLPFDPMQDGSGAAGQAKQQVAQSYGQQQVPHQSEVQRTVLKQSMMEKLGIKSPMSNGPKAVRTAMIVDAILQKNPSMTRSQAMATAQGQ